MISSGLYSFSHIACKTLTWGIKSEMLYRRANLKTVNLNFWKVTLLRSRLRRQGFALSPL